MDMDKKSTPPLHLIAQKIFDKKGHNIIGIDIRNISTFADYLIVAEGNNERHLSSIAVAIEEALAEQGIRSYGGKGFKSDDWIVLDYVDFFIHLFTAKLRLKYQLEQRWGDGKVLDLGITTQRPQGDA
jgi:ribosome-associated protein